MNSKMVVLVWENPTYTKNRFKPNFAGFSTQYTTPVAAISAVRLCLNIASSPGASWIVRQVS